MTRLILAGAAFVASLAVVALAQQTRDAGPRPAGTAALGGRVVSVETADRRPVARAVVTIDMGDGRGARQTVTGDDGQFLFDSLPAGRFLLTASKVGWVTSYYGSPRPGRPPGVRVAIDDGARVTVEIPIVPGGVIAGRMVDETGQPMARQWPWLLESRLVGDRRMLAQVRFPLDIGWFERSTDDLGEFRLFGLPPGSYYLVVNPPIPSGARLTTTDEVRWALQPPGAGRPPPPSGPVAGYASMYYPGTADPAAARAIVVGPGEVRDNLDFRVGFVRVARIEGVARRPDGVPAAGARIALDARVPQVSLEGSSRGATADASGRFVFQNVPPGDYRISARLTPPAGRPGDTTPPAQPAALLWAQADVIVAGQDVPGVGLTLAPASVITGRVTFAATSLAPPTDLTSVRLQFLATAELAAAMTGAGSGGNAVHRGEVAADGTFRVSGLPPDRYTVLSTWPGMRSGDGTAGWWLTTVFVDGRDLGDAPIEVRANEDVANVTLGFRDRIGAIEGVLTDAAGRPAPEYFVVAFPVERASWTTTSRRAVPAVRPGTDGHFRLGGLLAGQYYLAVVTAVEADETTDPAFLEAILPLAMRITVGEGETRRQDLRIGGRPLVSDRALRPRGR